MSWVVRGLVSQSFDRVNFPGQPWRKHVIEHTPFKRLKNAKRLRAKWNKSRAIFDCGDGFKDYGPSFTRVWIEEVQE